MLNYKMMKNNIISSLTLLACLQTGLSGQTFYAGNTVRLFTIDDLTDANPLTQVGSDGTDITGLAWVEDNSTLYGINNNQFYSIDPDTGNTTIINSNTDFNAADMAYDSVNNVLYGANNGEFFSIDIATGNMSSISNNPTFNINAMAFDSVNDILYGANVGGGFVTQRLFTIDRGTGVYTEVGDLGDPVRGMAFDPTTGILYGGNSGNDFFTINTTDGSTTILNNSTSFDIEAMTVVPEPSSYALFAGIFTVGIIFLKRRLKTGK